MKLYSNKAEQFIKSPKGGMVLVYGNDQGLVRDITKRVCTAFLGSRDVLAIKELDGEDIKKDPALFLDEVMGMSFFAEKRVVIVNEPENGFLELIQEVIAKPIDDVFIIIAAGELGRESKLRKFFEESQALMTLLCYKEDAQSIRNYIVGKLRENGVSVDADALDYMIANLGEDKLITQNEMEKVLLFLGKEKKLSFEDVTDILADNGELTIMDIAFAVSARDTAKLEKALSRAYGENVNPVPILRMVLWQLQRLMTAKQAMAAGANMDEAVKQLRPAVFFRQVDQFKLSLRKWNEEQIKRALITVNNAELMVKSSTIDPETVCRQELLKLAIAA